MLNRYRTVYKLTVYKKLRRKSFTSEDIDALDQFSHRIFTAAGHLMSETSWKQKSENVYQNLAISREELEEDMN